MTVEDTTVTLESGETVYDEDGTIIGVVTERTGDGVAIETIQDVDVLAESFATDESIPGQEFGEGYLVWRCRQCGAMGELGDGLPAACPDCGAADDELVKVTED